MLHILQSILNSCRLMVFANSDQFNICTLLLVKIQITVHYASSSAQALHDPYYYLLIIRVDTQNDIGGKKGNTEESKEEV